MFMLKSLGKMIWGDPNKSEVVSIPSGQLYLVRPGSLKGLRECIFKDAAACIRRTTTEYHYQMVIQRVYEEGEEEFDENEEEDDLSDEKTFLIDESLQFRTGTRDGCVTFAWRDLSGDKGDLYEFVCDKTSQTGSTQTFELVMYQCMFERKYRRSHENATDADLEQFTYVEPERQEQPATPPRAQAPVASKTPAKTPVTKSPAQPKYEAPPPEPTTAPPARARPEGGEVLAEVTAELHLFDAAQGVFMLQDQEVTAVVTEVGQWQYWLSIDGKDKPWLGQPLEAEMNPVFNYEHTSFIWNYYDDESHAYSWLLRFKDIETEEKFQEGVMRALWERLNEVKWTKVKDDERDYVMEAFQEDTDMPDVPEEDEEEEEQYADAQQSADYDMDEDWDNEATKMDAAGENSQLAVGYKHDRSFVVRGNKIGVFKHTNDNRLEFATTINKVQNLKGVDFDPSKVMLHEEDSAMLLQNPNDPTKIFRMDLEYGKVVDEWNVGEDKVVKTFGPSSKYAQMTGEKTVLGLGPNSLFRIDPRLSGMKLVESEHMQYATKNDFSAIATTETGFVAVASNKGDIRLFDRVGIRAKCQLPALGEAIIGIDVTADGKWILATCKTYLLLIDATVKDGKYVGELGFKRGFAKDSKPRPRRLQLKPEHIAMFPRNAPLSFTPAKFNAGTDTTETSIITSTGPYVVTWNFKQVQKGQLDKYQIKSYGDEVKADNFKFGSDKNVIVALPHDVSMVAKQAFRKPTRESLSTPIRNRINRSHIVNSPF
ncbi:Vacuolar import and degradation protein 27 [Saitoella coloradoensis]